MSGRRLRALAVACLSAAAMATAAANTAKAASAAGAVHADAPGIDWFTGDVPAAFAAAAASHRPVFLYWGAKWCPPCQQLKSSVFARQDFIQKSRQFVTVYLDGDEPQAQSWGQKFEVLGYPTVVILRPDQKEITRISGGVDLSLYADLLDSALGDTRPMSAVLATLLNPQAALTKADCQRLAYYGWDLKDVPDPEKIPLAQGLDRAANACPESKPEERARLSIAAATFALNPDLALRIVGIVADARIASKTFDLLAGLGEQFFAQVGKLPPAEVAAFQQNWTSAMEAVANDAAVIDADQLAAVGAELSMWKAFATDGQVPKERAEAARRRVSAALAKRVDPYVRSGVVGSAAYIYSLTGDTDAEYALFKGELTTAKAPYYYMADLGGLEEERGHKAEALAWYERAYRESEGVATRFQWGSSYLSALLRLTPADASTIRTTGLAVIGELDGPQRIQARTRRGLDRLETRLRTWNDGGERSQERKPVIEALRNKMHGICGKLPPSDGGLESCRKFLN